jgi:hypothetical protein
VSASGQHSVARQATGIAAANKNASRRRGAHLIVDLAKQGELDHSGHRTAVAKVLDLTEDWTERLYRAAASIVGIRSGQTNELCGPDLP